MRKIKVNINDVYARIVTTEGSFITIPLTESPHYKFLKGNEQPYFDYMELAKQPEHSVSIFRKLISEFDIKKSKNVQCRPYNGIYIIQDGFHRSCIMLFKGYTEIEILIK